MAIISASRRTDIPAFFSEWFMERLKEGYLMVRNPFNRLQVSKILLNKDVIDCIAFWTKDPRPMMLRLAELEGFGIPYFFQFTITGCGSDIEPGVPDKRILTAAFRELHDRCGGHVIWRYDPILFTAYHLRAFEAIASELCGYTDRCVISFADIYPHIRSDMSRIGLMTPCDDELMSFCKCLSAAAAKYGMKISTCAETVDLEECGIVRGRCIDPEYIGKLIGCPVKDRKDASQRKECGCAESIDIGTYSTCRHGCIYCYARRSNAAHSGDPAVCDLRSPMLCDSLHGNEKITERRLTSIKKTK